MVYRNCILLVCVYKAKNRAKLAAMKTSATVGPGTS
jgi:hypothetical protein